MAARQRQRAEESWVGNDMLCVFYHHFKNNENT